MIGTPSRYAPSTLLCDDPAPPVVQKLLKESRAARNKGEWMRAGRCATDALQFSQTAADQASSALAQIHLADFYCEVGELAHAMRYGLEAYQLTRHQPGHIHRHNQAVAAYALGLLEELHLFGAIRALKWYQESVAQFGAAREYWITRNDISRAEACERTRRRIENLSERIVKSRASARPWRASFAIWQVHSGDMPFASAGDLQGYLVDAEHIVIGETEYRARPAIGSDEQHYRFALPVPEDQWAVPDAQAGDYLLIRQQWKADQEKIGVVWEPGSGWMPVNFTRTRSGQIVYHALEPRIIGDHQPAEGSDPADKLKGYVVAILKPEG